MKREHAFLESDFAGAWGEEIYFNKFTMQVELPDPVTVMDRVIDNIASDVESIHVARAMGRKLPEDLTSDFLAHCEQKIQVIEAEYQKYMK